ECMNYQKQKIAIIGLGYVGLPLAIEFAKYFSVTGFDLDTARIREIENGIDRTNEADLDELRLVVCEDINNERRVSTEQGLRFSNNIDDIRNAAVFIVTVPTPINKHNAPDLGQLLKASEMLGSILKRGDIVIYESTVYPGCTEEDCVPILERMSGLRYNEDFFVGYSPERVIPGDSINTLTTIKKLTSGSTREAACEIESL